MNPFETQLQEHRLQLRVTRFRDLPRTRRFITS
jgi:hypothetical protein